MKTATGHVQPIWQPRGTQSTAVDRFRHHINKKYSLNLTSYQELWKWSVHDVGIFNAELAGFIEIKYLSVCGPYVESLDKMWPRPTWFPGARLNFSENLLSYRATEAQSIAVSACREGGIDPRHYTRQQLYMMVEQWTDALRSVGLQKGDVLAAVMTNCPECLVLLLACGAIGAIFSCTSPEMGEKAILQRYRQISPKLLFVDSEGLYNGKRHDFSRNLAAVGKDLSTCGLQQIVVCQGPDFAVSGVLVESLENFLSHRTNLPLKFEQVAFDYPIYILYSSGTTGLPKCICHSGGGALLQQKKELVMTFDISSKDCYYQYTTTGWMMWNYAMAALSTGARIFLYDGSPMVPSCKRQLEILAREKVTVWGTSPRFLNSLRNEIGEAKSYHQSLSDLRIVSSAGSALAAETSRWFYSAFPARIALFNGSGGTDLVGGIIMGTPMLPIYAGEIQAAVLGLKVEIWDEEGRNIEESGEAGDLVISKPFPSMPICFWGDFNDQRYYNSYFAKFPGVWCHGDLIKKNRMTAGYEVIGRSDGVLNPGGVRFGSAEIYSAVESFRGSILDCIVAGRRKPGGIDEDVLMFLKMKPGCTLTHELSTRVQTKIRKDLSARHVPHSIMQVSDIPYTSNGKKVENVVKAIVNGRKIRSATNVANPECLAEYYQYKLDEPKL